MDQLSDQSKNVGQFDDHSSRTITPFAFKPWMGSQKPLKQMPSHCSTNYGLFGDNAINGGKAGWNP